MATEIIKLIEEFAVKNGQLDKMNAQLGQKKDGPELRAKLSAARDSCKVPRDTAHSCRSLDSSSRHACTDKYFRDNSIAQYCILILGIQFPVPSQLLTCCLCLLHFACRFYVSPRSCRSASRS
jgi:hypothetical protein